MLSGYCHAVLVYCSEVCCSTADTHHKQRDHVVSGARFLTWGVFECDVAHRRYETVLCMLHKVKYNPMHLLYGALSVPCVPVRVTRSLVANRYTDVPPRCRTSQYRRIFSPLSVSLWNDHGYHVFDGVGLAGFKSRANAFLWA